MKVRVGVIGVGGIAGVHLQNLSQNEHVELVALCDIIPESVEKAAKQYGAVAYTDAHLLLEREELDALFLCVPPFAHGDLEERAVAQGIHLFVEKPLGLEMEGVRRKAEVIRQSGVICSTGYCLRYLDIVEKAKHYLEGKKIAMIRGYYLTSFVETPWYRRMSKSGGQLVEQSTHTVDLVRYFGGDVQRVFADMALLVMQDQENIDIPDVGFLHLTFESGALGHVATTFTQPDHRAGLEIMGRDFRVELDLSSLTIVEKGKETLRCQSNVDFYREQDDAFIEAIRTGDRSRILSTYDNALRTLEVTLAANQSVATGAPIKLVNESV